MLENQEQTLTLSATELLELIKTESVQLLDVRDPDLKYYTIILLTACETRKMKKRLTSFATLVNPSNSTTKPVNSLWS